MIRRVVPRAFGRSLAAVLFGALVGMSAPSAAAPESNDPQAPAPNQPMEQATKHLLRALELMLMAIPRYAPPEVLDNGDIIIRRIRPEDEDAPPAARERNTPERKDI